MKVILNLLPLKTGGGVQVAKDFLNQLNSYDGDDTWLVVARENGPFVQIQENERVKLIKLVPDNIFSRVWFEYVGCKKVVKEYEPDVIYTQFGPHWPGAKCKQIAGCAYSNLFYPELDFWVGLSRFKKWVKLFIDRMRLRRVLSVDYKIFETEDLANRAIQQHGLNPESVMYVRPAVSSNVTESTVHMPTRIQFEPVLKDGFKILLLSGYHPNKNIEFIVEVAAKLKSLTEKKYVFVLTLPPENSGTKNVIKLARDLGVSDRILNIGPVPQEGCSEIYRLCDAAVLPSNLESFSNMIAESWAMKKPLFISDLSWARSLCGDAAIYFEHKNSDDLAAKIVSISNDKKIVGKVILNGSTALASYPSSQQRFEGYLKIIHRVGRR